MRTILSVMGMCALVGCGPAVAQEDCPPEPPAPPAKYDWSWILPPAIAIDTSELLPLCMRERGHPICVGSPGRQPTLKEVQEVDGRLRARFSYRSDAFMFGRADHWTSKSVCGDCEDYALALSARLAAEGYRGEDMVLSLWFPTRTTAHATLVIFTSDGPVEVGVGASETPAPFEPSRGRRFAWMVMDGQQKWIR